MLGCLSFSLLFSLISDIAAVSMAAAIVFIVVVGVYGLVADAEANAAVGIIGEESISSADIVR